MQTTLLVCSILTITFVNQINAGEVPFVSISESAMSWEKAEMYCQNKGFVLYSPRAEDTLPKLSVGTNYWIDAKRDPKNRAIFRDSNGQDVTKEMSKHFADGEPNDKIKGVEDCIHIISGTNKLNDNDCNTSSYKILAACVSLPKPTVEFEEFSTSAMNFESAKQYCQEKGLVLYSPHSGDIFPPPPEQNKKTYWIDAKRDPKNRAIFRNSRGQDITKEMSKLFIYGEPNDENGNEDCIHVKWYKSNKLNDLPCDPPTIVPVIAACVSPPKPTVKFEEVSATKMEFESAKQYCKNKGLSLYSPRINDVLPKIASDKNYWIDVRRDPKDRTIFRDSNGKDVTAEMQEKFDENQDCVYILQGTTQLKSVVCENWDGNPNVQTYAACV